MIRVYVALFLLLITGMALYATGNQTLEHLGAVEIVAALIGLHAHYHHQE